MTLATDTLERIVPDQVQQGDVTGESTLDLHVARYQFAAEHCRPGRLLDISCGVGYGTQMMVERNPQVESATGVDLSTSAIDYAKERYADSRIEFMQADAMTFTSDEPFDTIVSLETVEHLPNPVGFLANIVQLLAPQGVLISSVPTTPSVDANPHHLHDFTESSFRKMFLTHGLVEQTCFRQQQSYQLFSVLARKEARTKDLRRNLPMYYLTHPTNLMRRLWATARHGFTNHYITIVWQKP